MKKFERLFEDYFHATYDYVYYMIGNQADTQAITQKVFHKVAVMYHQWQDDEPASTWVFKLAQKTTLDFLRKNKQDLTSRTLAYLPENMRSVLYFRYNKGLSVQETAKYLDVTPKQVSATENQALTKMSMKEEKV